MLRYLVFIALIVACICIASTFAATPSFCMDPAETGICRAYFEKYAYNSTLNKCTQFVWGGCGGNNNTFDTEQDCMNTCMNSAVGITSNTPFIFMAVILAASMALFNSRNV